MLLICLSEIFDGSTLNVFYYSTSFLGEFGLWLALNRRLALFPPHCTAQARHFVTFAFTPLVLANCKQHFTHVSFNFWLLSTLKVNKYREVGGRGWNHLLESNELITIELSLEHNSVICRWVKD